MSKDLRPSFDVSFTTPDDTKSDGSTITTIALRQVEDTSCDDIEFVLYNKKSLVVDLDCTVGRYATLGRYYEDIDEPVVLSGSKAAGVSTPGVVQVYSMTVVGSIFKLHNKHLVPAGSGRLLFDMETEEVKWTGEGEVYCVVHISYKSKGTRYKFVWPSSDSIVDALVIAVASDGNAASLSLSREGCNDEDNNNGQYTNTTSENTHLVLDLKMVTSWTVAKPVSVGPIVLYSLVYIYPVYTTGVPELRVAFGKTGTLAECQFIEESGFPEFRDISEAVNFSNSAIANVGNFVGSFSNFSIAAQSAFYDSKNNRVLIPTLRGPGSSVDVEEWFDYEVVETDPITGRSKNVSIRQKVRFSKTLGPTEVAHVNAMGVLMPVTGVARANYRVPQKVGILKVPVTVSNDEFKTWYCEAFGTYVYLDIVSGKPVVFTGNTNIGNPVGSNPALDAREKAIQTRVSQL